MTTSKIVSQLKKFVTWSEDNYVAEELLLIIKDADKLGVDGMKKELSKLIDRIDERYMIETIGDFIKTF